jgi:hypothetical protein
MRKLKYAFAAACALPLTAPALSQAPGAVDLDSVVPLSGSWIYRPIAGGSEAAFVDQGAARRVVIRCNRVARIVSIVRTAVPAAAPTLSIWTTSGSRAIASRFEATKVLTADIAATDPLLDSIAFSRGRFATAAASAPMLAVAVSPEPARVIEDCRS